MSNDSIPARTQDEILARIEAVAGEDFMGFAREVLVDALDFQHAQPFLKPETTQERWDEVRPSDLDAKARDYLAFAIGKIQDHRGISASRSVDKLTQYAWLLGRDDVVTAMDSADYQQYGAPKVRAFAVGMGYDWPTDQADLNNMAEGDLCMPFCEEGCGR